MMHEHVTEVKAMTKRTAKNDRQRGFTILELLVALSLLAIGLLATASMQGIAMNANSIANRLSVAASLGQQVAEDFLSRKIADPVLNTASVDLTYDLDPLSAATSITIPGAGTYDARYSITPNAVVDGASQTGTTQIDVSIRYTVKDGSTKVVTYTTYKRVV